MQLGKANYTAKTDWLRRQLDHSSQVRVRVTKASADYAASIGERLWLLSLAVQLLWHVMLIQGAVVISEELNPNSWTVYAARAVGLPFAYLPTTDRVISCSFWLSLLSCWWNPKWVQWYRGFSQHLYGFWHYYSYQGMILALKFPGYLDVSMMNTPRAQRLNVQIVVHGLMAIFMWHLYRSARRSIRTDNKQLWLPVPKSILATPPSTLDQPLPISEPADSAEKSMGDILDDILNEPTQKPAVDSRPHTPHPKGFSISQFDDLPMIGMKGSTNPFRSTTPTPGTAAPPYTPRTPYTPDTPFKAFNAQVSSVNEFDHVPSIGSRFSYNSVNNPIPQHPPPHRSIGAKVPPRGPYGPFLKPSHHSRLPTPSPPVDEFANWPAKAGNPYKPFLKPSHHSRLAAPSPPVDHFDNWPHYDPGSLHAVLAIPAGTNPFRGVPSTPATASRPDTSASNLGFGGLSLSDDSQPRIQTRAQTRAQARALQSPRDSLFQNSVHQPVQQQSTQQPDGQQLFQRSVQQLLPQQQFRQSSFQQTHTDYEEEMEWTHTQSQHRAFSTYKPGEEKRGFNAAPVADNPNKVFWAKIPPKPITPAQRVYNPPGQPVIRTSPALGPPTTTNSFGFKGAAEGTSTGSSMFRTVESPDARPPSTEFAPPSFLPPPPRDDRDSLVEIFKRGFSLSDGTEDEDDGAGNSPQGGQTLVLKLKYSLVGLCVAVIGHLVYQKVVHA